MGIDFAYSCMDDKSAWSKKIHTANQLKQVVMDGAIYKNTVLTELESKRVTVGNARSLSGINKVSDTFSVEA